MRRKCRAMAVAGLAVLATRCGSSPARPSAQTPLPTSVSVTVPGELRVGGAAVQAIARAQYSDGSSADVTASATWSSSNTNVLTVSAAGLITAAAEGDAAVRAAYAGVNGAISLHVAPPLIGIAGRVTERYNGAPIPGATVAIVSGADAGRSTVTGADGSYVLDGLVSPVVSLAISADGFAPRTVDIASTVPETVQLDPLTVEFVVSGTFDRRSGGLKEYTFQMSHGGMVSAILHAPGSTLSETVFPLEVVMYDDSGRDLWGVGLADHNVSDRRYDQLMPPGRYRAVFMWNSVPADPGPWTMRLIHPK